MLEDLQMCSTSMLQRKLRIGYPAPVCLMKSSLRRVLSAPTWAAAKGAKSSASATTKKKSRQSAARMPSHKQRNGDANRRKETQRTATAKQRAPSFAVAVCVSLRLAPSRVAVTLLLLLCCCSGQGGNAFGVLFQEGGGIHRKEHGRSRRTLPMARQSATVWPRVSSPVVSTSTHTCCTV